MRRYLQALRDLGFERLRVAVSLLPLSLFSFLFLLNALMGPPEFQLAFAGMAACYFTAFIALAAEWFWARWFASGIGWSGAMMGAIGMTQPDAPMEVLGFVLGLHALVILLLMGPKMAARYDLQEGWRQRFGMDEFGVIRLRKAVTRASAALPGLIFMALAPKQGPGQLLTFAALGLALVGLRGLVRLRTWGLFALCGAAGAALTAAPIAWPRTTIGLTDGAATALASPGAAGALALLLFAAALPFAGGVVRYLRAAR